MSRGGEENQRLLGVVYEDQESEDDEQIVYEIPPPPPPSAPQRPPMPFSAPQHPPMPPSAPTPLYTDPTPATIATGQSGDTSGAVFQPADTSVLPPPPDYSMHAAPMVGMVPPKYTPMAGAAVPVNIQMDGRLVPATLMQDPSGNHTVYICEPQGSTEGEVPTASGRPDPPKDHFGLAVIALFCSFFFLPLAIMAVLKSIEVHRRYKLGDYVGAQMASKKAHSWGSASVIFGIFSILLLVSLRYFLKGHQYRHYYY